MRGTMGKIYSFGEWQLDARLCELWSAGKPLELEPKAFDVLLYLIEHRDGVVSNRSSSIAYGLDRRSGRQHWLAVLIAARRTIGDNGRAPVVYQNLRNHGYRFIAPVEESVDALSEEEVRDELRLSFPIERDPRDQAGVALLRPCHLDKGHMPRIGGPIPPLHTTPREGYIACPQCQQENSAKGEFLWGVRGSSSPWFVLPVVMPRARTRVSARLVERCSRSPPQSRGPCHLCHRVTRNRPR